ncbi:MAG: transposase family protein [Chloroflexi bacterium]|nr:MAG: transposase family protein [Chloroflexota bacterium]
MITYEKILKNPHTANGLIGMSLAEFEELYIKFELAHTARVNALQSTRRDNAKRRRAVGAGRKYKYALCDRLLMTLFWLRAYTTYSVLGTLYDLDKSTIEENLKTVIQTLSLMACFNLQRPLAEIPKLRSVREVIDAFPDLLLVNGPEEQQSQQKQ